ncbi:MULTISPECIES: hypothetical protein [Kitasatospora]|uniref:hypothetical protein n=1 Tax=Kitasatospora TaxID=2063 RepID=UPI000C70B139|nr:hypothetical protein [Kitasatospora sp. GP30]MDH6138246.1 hypothetical protein [Kitasatospora sp. GP30]
MFSMQVARFEGERPPRLELLAAAVAVGYTAGYGVAAGNAIAQAIGAAVASGIAWLWARWRQ